MRLYYIIPRDVGAIIFAINLKSEQNLPANESINTAFLPNRSERKPQTGPPITWPTPYTELTTPYVDIDTPTPKDSLFFNAFHFWELELKYRERVPGWRGREWSSFACKEGLKRGKSSDLRMRKFRATNQSDSDHIQKNAKQQNLHMQGANATAKVWAWPNGQPWGISWIACPRSGASACFSTRRKCFHCWFETTCTSPKKKNE